MVVADVDVVAADLMAAVTAVVLHSPLGGIALWDKIRSFLNINISLSHELGSD